MCAINGFTGPADRSLIEKMNAVTKHRGPDGTNIFESEGITLGHNRLAILDPRPLAGQPMADASGRYVICYNGELYNFKELRAQYAYPYKTEGDTEVILAGWAAEGQAILKKLNGVFAFALWDTKTHTLYLARDRAGVNPLYYARAGERFVFSSEIKAILEHDIPRTCGKDALALYLRLLYVPGPKTMFDGIAEVEPGHALAVQGSIVTNNPFAPDSRKEYPAAISFADAVSQTRELVQSAVRSQMISDKPLGLLLSGGIDSTVVLSAAAAHAPGVDAFSIAWDDLKPEDEARFNADARIAAQSAARFGARHHLYRLQTKDVPALLEDAVWHLDTPVSSASLVSQLALARFAKQKVDVVLSGDGGDELFGGYERYRLSLIAGALDHVPPVRELLSLFPYLNKVADRPDATRIARHLLLNRDEVSPLVTLPPERDMLMPLERMLDSMPQAPFTQKMIWFDRMSWLADHSLVRTNKMSMAAGLEQRVPILDDRLLSFAEPLPLSYKVTPFETKRLLRHAFKDELAPVLGEPKRGWFSPGAKWLRHDAMQALVREALSPEYYAGTRKAFDFAAIERYIDEHQTGRRYRFTVLWALLTFQLWAKRFKVTVQ